MGRLTLFFMPFVNLPLLVIRHKKKRGKQYETHGFQFTKRYSRSCSLVPESIWKIDTSNRIVYETFFFRQRVVNIIYQGESSALALITPSKRQEELYGGGRPSTHASPLGDKKKEFVGLCLTLCQNNTRENKGLLSIRL